jgi:DNA polymerase
VEVSLPRAGVDTTSAADFLPGRRDIVSLRAAAASCRGCDLYATATQTVFGDGPATAALMLVGEQPGDYEDRRGVPFVGPAGAVLDRALTEIGLRREDVYMTNAVKHFKWRPAGRRRIHETPRASEGRACLPWLEAEAQALQPRLVVCLGATAVRSVLGPEIKVLANRGRVLEGRFGASLVTVHPSSVLRVAEPGEREAAFDAFVADLRRGAEFVGCRPRSRPPGSA